VPQACPGGSFGFDSRSRLQHYGLKAAINLAESYHRLLVIGSAADAALAQGLPIAASARTYALDCLTIAKCQRREIALALRSGSATIEDRVAIRRTLTDAGIVLS
jgi:hypothetical protein